MKFFALVLFCFNFAVSFFGFALGIACLLLFHVSLAFSNEFPPCFVVYRWFLAFCISIPCIAFRGSVGISETRRIHGLLSKDVC